MRDNIINIDFRKPDERWLKKAHTARENGDVERAVQLYRKAVEQDPANWDTGLCYARYLWELGCWHASNRECLRLLSMEPDNHRIYGLLYRNYLCLDEQDNARFAYEKYMMHLYRNPEDGLNLNEEDPPIPEKPAKKRFQHLLDRARKLLERGEYDKANHLLVHANRATFPRECTERDLLEVELMFRTGLVEDANNIVYGLVSEGKLNACQAISLMPMMCEQEDKEYASHLLLYACINADSPQEVCRTVSLAVKLNQPSLAKGLLDNLLQLEPYRLDALYQLAACQLHLGDLKAAHKAIQLCYQLDPCDPEVDYLYRVIQDGVDHHRACEEILQMPLSFYDGPVSYGRLATQIMMAQTMGENTMEENLALLMNWPDQNKLMEALRQCGQPMVESLVNGASDLEEAEQEQFLRRMLLTGGLTDEWEDEAFQMLSELGISGMIPVMRAGKLTERMLAKMPGEDDDDFEDDDLIF